MPCWLRGAQANSESALDRLIDAGLLFRLGLPPHATYLALSSTSRFINSRILQSAVVIAEGRADAAVTYMREGLGIGQRSNTAPFI